MEYARESSLSAAARAIANASALRRVASGQDEGLALRIVQCAHLDDPHTLRVELRLDAALRIERAPLVGPQIWAVAADWDAQLMADGEDPRAIQEVDVE